MRFWKNVRKVFECWTWTGRIAADGYGKLARSGEKSQRGAHVISWEIHHGPVPPGMYVLHKCDVRHCVRPEHLFLGSMADNVHDMMSKGRGRAARGAALPQTKLTEDHVRQIRARTLAGESYNAISKEMGVTRETIRRAAVGIDWKHIV